MSKLHPDSKCENLLKDFEMPNVYSSMYEKQHEFQKFMSSKRNHISLPDNNITFEQIQEAVYHYICLNMELKELKDAWNRSILEQGFEFIDVLCFLMNIGIYSGITKLSSETFVPEDLSFEHILTDYIDELPFKKWKTYTQEQLNCSTNRETAFSVLFFSWINYGKKRFRYTEQDLYNMYMSKLEENYNRQTDKSKGYV